MSDCPNFRHLLITRPDVLKSRIGSAFSKIPKWFTCEVIVPFVITHPLQSRHTSLHPSATRRRFKHAGCPFHGDVFPVELGWLARTPARNFLDLRSGREPPKHCTL